ncbi:hypothetical protein [Zunongwangia profunda]|uniref:hypothetical protein n=1 Tax=Zunongwangia profunda TaxID=398743 RepID=UPI00248E3B74|nr:hypothetical protein [Zunongwangia profunda]|tara:strand:+ start:6080 stop:6352 length:273 start_codon:yes stop_codon:yes gene_type:complete
MKYYDTITLREVLNYDTHGEKFLSLLERHEIHKAISNGLNGLPVILEEKLESKVTQAKKQMKHSGYKPREIAYYMDFETMLLRTKELNKF